MLKFAVYAVGKNGSIRNGGVLVILGHARNEECGGGSIRAQRTIEKGRAAGGAIGRGARQEYIIEIIETAMVHRGHNVPAGSGQLPASIYPYELPEIFF